jgi:large subunit ribosomal protein L5
MTLREKYKKEIVPKLKEKFGYKNNLMAPKIKKVVLNVGVGRQAKEQAFVDTVFKNLQKISGQKPIFTKAKKAISAFKSREGMVIGVAVTLRGKRMYDFLNKLINSSFPRVRDFRGISDKQIDRNGNLTVGFKEHTAFPEIKNEEADTIHGLEVCIATSAKTRDEGLELFRLLGFPFNTNK